MNDLTVSPIHMEATQFAFRVMTDWSKAINVNNGWYEDDRPFSAEIALLHSEVSEAYEAWRDQGMAATIGYKMSDGTKADFPKGGPDDMVLSTISIGKPLGVASELADVLVRLLDTADRCGVDLVAEFEAKVRYNATRGYKHGGKTE